MKIKALGAVGTVTGSCFRIEMDDGNKVLLDCGLFQGGKQTELRNTNTGIYNPDQISAIILTHAHMDHTGLVPRLIREGYNGPIYATEATCDLLKVLWIDAANIQEQEAIWQSRKNLRQGKKAVDPLYTEDDARRAMSLLKSVPFKTPIEVIAGLTANFCPAGHILGAASVHLTIQEAHDPSPRRIVFSGDIGRTEQLLMPAPETPPEADTVFMETTYGNRLHKDTGTSVIELLEAINTAWQEGGKILIPSFAVERTQEILLLLAQAWHENKIPQEMPIILDSPLATQTSEVYSRYVELFDEESRAFLGHSISSETLPSLRITRDAQESQKINDITGSALIIAGSGMANAGRILHHLKHNLWRPNCHVIFVGFQAQGTIGRRLVEGVKIVKIFQEEINVEAKIHTIGGFSGHADQHELLSWLGHLAHPGLTVNLIHGEPSSTRDFMTAAQEKFPEINFNIPSWLQYTALADQEIIPTEKTPDKGKSVEALLAPSLADRLAQLQKQAQAVERMEPSQLALLEEYLARAESILLAEANGTSNH